VLCDDKGVWLQGRECWMFSKLYNSIKKNQKWLDYAKYGYDFLRENCFDDRGRMYFSVTREGEPLRMRRYYVSESFMVMAAAEYSIASGDSDAKDFALKLFDTLCGYYFNPDENLFPAKTNQTTRPSMGHNGPMMIIGTAQLLRDCFGTEEYDSLIMEQIELIFEKLLKQEHKALLEMATPNGDIIDTPEGRIVCPGNSVETAWFCLKEGIYRKDERMIDTACNILEWSFEMGWDKKYGGLFTFIDIKGLPCEKVEWDMKYWWTHTELIYAALLAHSITGEDKFEKIFDKANKYAFSKFSDPVNGEWYGYCHRDGSVALKIKGSMFKGGYHVPRLLLYSIKLFEEMLAEAE